MTNMFVFFLEFFVLFAEFSMGLVQLKRSLETFTLSSRVSSCLVWRASSLWFNLETSCRWISSWLSWECWCWEWWNWKVDWFGTGFPFSCCQRLTYLFLIQISKLKGVSFNWKFNPEFLINHSTWSQIIPGVFSKKIGSPDYLVMIRQTKWEVLILMIDCIVLILMSHVIVYSPI